jgi:hypothetical protein
MAGEEWLFFKSQLYMKMMPLKVCLACRLSITSNNSMDLIGLYN